jgi:hypothetical protein
MEDLRSERIREAIDKYGPIKDRWVLRLGKNEEEAGKFEAWYMGPEDFEEDFAGFLACLHLVQLVDSVTNRMKDQKSTLRAVKKEVKALAKVAAKAEAKLEKTRKKAEKKAIQAAEKAKAKAAAEEAKGALRITRAEEKAKIKEEARLARLSSKHSIDSVVFDAPANITSVVVQSEVKAGWKEFEEAVEVRPKIFAIPEEN